MKKKVLITIAVLLAVWCVVFAVDYARCMDLQKPLFTVASTADDGGSGTYHGLGYRVEIEGHLDAEYGYAVKSTEIWLFGVVLIGAAIT